LATFIGTAAQAAPAVDVNDAATVRIHLTGASASRAAVAGVVLNDICGGSATNTTTTLYNVAESGTAFTFNGNYWAITCKLPSAGATYIGLPVNTAIAFFKSDAGGSAQGVFPIFNNSDATFVQPAPLTGCTVATSTTTPNPNIDRVYTACPATRIDKPNFGTSDVEPALFTGINVPNDANDPNVSSYPAGGLSPSDIAKLEVTPIFQTVFALAVNTNLYTAMFAKQSLAAKKDAAGLACTTASTDETCIPSVGYAEARSLLQGFEPNWRLLVNSVAPTLDSKLDSQVNICRRVQGSGTQAAANLALMGFPCNGSALTPADYNASSSAAPDAVSAFTNSTLGGLTIAQYLDANMGGAPTGTPLVYPAMPTGTAFFFEGPGTGDVVSCLTRANNGGGYALGHVSKENVPNANWKHVRLEGAYPSRDNLKVGRYDYAVESTLQWQKAAYAGFTASQKTFVTNFAKKIQLSDSLAKLSAANQQGVAALPGSNGINTAFGTGSPNEISFVSRVTRAGNSCNPLTAVK
jgi:hypothetical protein